MTALLNFVKHWLNRQVEPEQQMESRVRQLTQASLGEVQHSMLAHWRQMNPSQARGYARAKARRQVTRNARTLFAHERNVSSAMLDMLVARAVEHVSQLLVHEMMTQPAMVKVRRAA